MYPKKRNHHVSKHQISDYLGFIVNKTMTLIAIPTILLLLLIANVKVRKITKTIIHQIILDLTLIMIIVVSLSVIFLNKKKIVITRNQIIYEFHGFKWATKLNYLITKEDFVSTSINKILEDIPKLILNVKVAYFEKIMKMTLELEFQNYIFPIRIKKITTIINNIEYFRNKEIIENNSISHLKSSGFVSFAELRDEDAFNISFINGKIFDHLADENLVISNYSLNYKIIQISPSLISPSFFKTNNILNHKFHVSDNNKLYLLSIRLYLHNNNQFELLNQKLSDQIEGIKIIKKRALHLISSSNIHQLNYSIINKIRLASQIVITNKLQSKDIDPIINKSNFIIASDNHLQDFAINLSDLKQGGIIAGAIGSGKTTLRLTIIENLIKRGISILDIDYKGDAPRLFRFQNKGLVLVPGKNLHLDIFDKPDNILTTEFVGILFRSFVESIHDGELTPPQQHILHEALRKTVIKRGNIETFFRNIIITSMESKEIIENYQQQTALALISKYNWLQTSMRNVFGVQGQSISGYDLARNNIFIDLSYIQHSAPNNHIRFFLDILITKLMIHYKSVESTNFSSTELPLSKIIFLDETHMIMPNKKSSPLTKLEELVVTLRHKGLSVIATTTNPELISNIFLDSGFIAQFRTESKLMQRSLGINNSEIKLLSQLPNFKFYLKSNSTKYSMELLKTKQFLDNSLNSSEYFKSITKYDISYVNEYRIENGDFQAALLESAVFHSMPIEPYRRIIFPKVNKYVQKYICKLDWINKEESYRQVILGAFSDYIEEDEGITELKVHSYVKCFLYEFLILIFKCIFVQISLGVNMKKGRIKDFRYQYKGLFLDLIVYVDELLLNYFREEPLEI